jgi:hypothetical protein
MTRLVLCLPFLLAACAQTPGPVSDTACLWVKPIYVSPADVLTTNTAAQILDHDEKWKANCK